MTTPNPTLQLLGKKIIFSTLIQYAGRFAQIVIAGFTIKLISNFLSENNYGIYATITEYALFFSVAANLGIFANIIRRMSVNPSDGKTFVNALYLRIFTALIFFAFGVIVLITMGSSTMFVFCTVIFFGALLFDFMTSVCDGMLQANYMMGRATWALILGRICTLLALYGIVQYFSHTPDSAVNFGDILTIFATLILGNIITFLLSFYFVTRKIHLH
jgi:O-antigen/teichoic acid export membrane protein